MSPKVSALINDAPKGTEVTILKASLVFWSNAINPSVTAKVFIPMLNSESSIHVRFFLVRFNESSIK